MKAAYVARLDGEPLANLEVGDLPEPELPKNGCRVRMRMSSLNHHDVWTLRGVSSRKVVPPQILGCDGVGVIEGYGDEAAQPYPVGTRVAIYGGRSCGMCDACRFGEKWQCKNIGMPSEGPYQGCFAEFLDVPTDALVALPDTVTDGEAACLPTAYVTAYRMLFERGGFVPGMTVLVQGASGGVATAATLLARAAGGQVIVTSRSEEKRSKALALGATRAVAPEKEALKGALSELSGDGADIVIETVGDATWDLSLRSVRPGGTVVVSGATTGGKAPSQLNRVFWFQLTIAGSTGGGPRVLERLIRMVELGAFHPAIHDTVPLDSVGQGVKTLVDGSQFGKILVRIS